MHTFVGSNPHNPRRNPPSHDTSPLSNQIPRRLPRLLHHSHDIRELRRRPILDVQALGLERPHVCRPGLSLVPVDNGRFLGRLAAQPVETRRPPQALGVPRLAEVAHPRAPGCGFELAWESRNVGSAAASWSTPAHWRDLSDSWNFGNYLLQEN